ncbi:MAG: IS200/IS605 family transposase [Epsilonproteobacteria bacterium]|nr:MAG: IS200/IS605 family transposase [Campylobacterota bacterium]
MVSQRWKHSKTCVYNVAYHLIWCPKYRRKVLVGEIEKELRKLLNSKAEQLDATIETMEIMPDHVHLFIKTKPTAAPHWIVQQLKGYTSHQLRETYPELKSRLPSLWTRSYYCESVGHISEDTIKKYIEEQKGR